MAAISVAAAVLVYGNAKKLLPVSLDSWVIQAAVVACVVCGCLALASIASGVVKASKGPRAELTGLLRRRRARRQLETYIPQMTSKERQIIAYLLAKNQRMFTNDLDGGEAITLISRGIVTRAVRPGQVFDPTQVPFEVPEHLWSVLLKHKAEFPYASPRPGVTEAHPWRTHWMAR